jgi:hypothetical protein
VGLPNARIPDDWNDERATVRISDQEGIEDVFLGLLHGFRITPEVTPGEFHRLVDGKENFFRRSLRLSEETAHVVFVCSGPEIVEAHGCLGF